ncbi:MAG: AI-2E family transporter [Chthoniobacter sp.]|uniref:AI-2E family transporter n=1 Tax=Chthoniobacter sp. TaxID=2510640 RepID=UPI0032A69434
MNTPEYPTPWQKKSIWTALTTLSVVSIGAVAVALIWLFSTVMAFLQPILIPFAVAGVLAYLFEPVVERIVKLGTSRKRAVLAVFAVVTIALTGILIWIIPAVWTQTGNLVQRVPAYRERVVHLIGEFNEWAHSLEQKYGVHVLPQIPKRIENPLAPEETAAPTPADGNTTAPPAKAAATPSPVPSVASPAASPVTLFPVPNGVDPDSTFNLQGFLQGDWLRTTLPVVLRNAWAFITRSVGGFLGVFGFLLSMVIVPIYLFYFLIESKKISESWGDYLPLRASVFKDEVVATLEEINGYLIAFFRGQLLVSMINGTVTGLLLVIFGLDFGILIGLMLCFLGIIPYLGITLCWVPAVIIAAVQGGSGTWVPGDPWWLFPVIVTAIFITVQQVDGLFITPKIVGESVGLHPMTVIASVFVWSLLLGGLLGAILAVPLTATVKVLLRRYIWERRLRAEENVPMTEETFEVQKARGMVKLEAPAVK